MPTKIHLKPSINDVDFRALKDAGIECLIFDVEGTLTDWGGDKVDDDIRFRIHRSEIKKIGLATNMGVKHRGRMQNVAQQIEADSYHTPETRSDRKPSPAMIEQCLSDLNADKQKTAMIGDKLLDVLAARRAGLATMVWVGRTGEADHWFDRFVYRRFEPLIKRFFVS